MSIPTKKRVLLGDFVHDHAGELMEIFTQGNTMIITPKGGKRWLYYDNQLWDKLKRYPVDITKYDSEKHIWYLSCGQRARGVYISGFDVFYPDAQRRGEEQKRICEEYFFKGSFPLDNEASNPLEIAQGNIHMIDESFYVAVNLNNFRGDDVDSGSAFELGYAFAKSKELYGYIDDDRALIDKISSSEHTVAGNLDANGFCIENFNMPVNLMLCAFTTIVKGTFEDCIKRMQQDRMKSFIKYCDRNFPDILVDEYQREEVI